MTTAHDPVDLAVREEIRTAHATTLLVEAGAGTGKTTALVNRVVAMVATGRLELAHLAAITFTEAAAAELRDRIRVGLEEVAAGDPSTPDPTARRRCSDALDHLDDTALTTLHGFAQRVLVSFPLEAGLPPRFDVLDEVEAGTEFDQRWDDLADELTSDPTLEPVLLRAFALGITLEGLRTVAEGLHDHADRLDAASSRPDPRIGSSALDLQPVLGPLDVAIAARLECDDAGDRLAVHLEKLRAWRRELDRTVDDVDRLDVLRDAPPLAKSIGRATSWSDVRSVRALLTDAAAARAGLLDRARREVIDILLNQVIGFVRDGLERRRREGRLEFQDLLVLAHRLLRDRPDVRNQLARRYHVIFIDEFQDTDPIQIQLAMLLSSPVDPSPADQWADLVPHAGALFLVGDPKQSIYGFRRADLALYDRAARVLAPGRRELVENFRSVPGILDWVNHVFDALLGDGEIGVQARAIPLRAHRPALPGVSSGVKILGGPLDERVGVIREAAANDIAELLRAIKREGWRVDDGDASTRPARFDDIALLLPTRAALPALEEALERAGVPARIESQSLVFATAEVREILSVLTALDDPTDEVALVAALRAPGFGCGDDDLAEHVAAGGRWTYLAPPPSHLRPGHPVPSALAALRELHERRFARSVADTVEEVVRTRRLFELAVAHRRPRDHWRRIRFLLDQARAYEHAGGAGLRGFAQWAWRQTDEGVTATEIIVPEPDDDAVRILTVHGAKGLEFPIVVLAGLEAQPVARNDPVRWDASGSPAIRVGVQARGTLFTSDGYGDLNHAAHHREQAERIRVLYVAATRARDHLVVALHHKRDAPCAAALLWPLMETAPCTTIEVSAVPAPDEAPVAHDTGGLATLEDRARWIAARHDALARANRPAALAATTLAAVRDGGDDAIARPRAEEEPADDAPPWRRGRAGTAIGRAVHATLQSIDLRTGDGLVPTGRAQALAEGIADREGEVVALARSVLDAPIVKEAGRSGRFWRELAVGAPVGDVVLEGFVDLLVDTPDGLVVVDYKTDATRSVADIDAAVERYLAQGATYALVLEQVLERSVARVEFLFARADGPAVVRPIPDLADAMHEVRDLTVQMSQPAG